MQPKFVLKLIKLRPVIYVTDGTSNADVTLKLRETRLLEMKIKCSELLIIKTEEKKQFASLQILSSLCR